MPKKRTRTLVQTRQRSTRPYRCKFRGCGRRHYARGLCQTHHRQFLNGEELKPIHPYRKRTPGTVKFAGLRVSPHCAAVVNRKAERDGTSRGAVIAEILEEWVRRPSVRRKTARNSNAPGARRHHPGR